MYVLRAYINWTLKIYIINKIWICGTLRGIVYLTTTSPKDSRERERERERDTAAPLSTGLEVGGCQSLIEDWIRTGKMNGRYCIKEDFVIFQCFFDLYFEES